LRASQADGASIFRQLADRGLNPPPRRAALVVLNTCTVTPMPIAPPAPYRRVHSRNPGKNLVTGATPTRPRENAVFRESPGSSETLQHAIADLALNDLSVSEPRAHTAHFVPIHTLLKSAPPLSMSAKSWSAISRPYRTASPRPISVPKTFGSQKQLRGSRTVQSESQDGCNNRCSFCIIPTVRGQSRSALSRESSMISTSVASGSREVVDLRHQIRPLGRDLTPALRFETLVEAILQQQPQKLRLSSSNPWMDRRAYA